MDKQLTIGALARQAGVNLETIRYYERSGLLAEPPRSRAGYRHYPVSAVQRLRFIRRGRELGFSLPEVRTLLELADHPQQSCEAADQLVAEHLEAVAQRIRDLQALQTELQRLARCASGSAEHCRLIEALDQRQCCS